MAFSVIIGVSGGVCSITGRPSNSSSSQYSKLGGERELGVGVGFGIGSGGVVWVGSGSEWVRGGDRREPV